MFQKGALNNSLNTLYMLSLLAKYIMYLLLAPAAFALCGMADVLSVSFVIRNIAHVVSTVKRRVLIYFVKFLCP